MTVSCGIDRLRFELSILQVLPVYRNSPVCPFRHAVNADVLALFPVASAREEEGSHEKHD